MTNREIEKYKKKLATITEELDIAKNEPLGQWLEKLIGGIRKLQDLADVVGAYKYHRAELRDIDRFLSEEMKKMAESGSHTIDLYERKCATCEDICNEIYHNIHYTLQTEEMFNACVSAKRSCRWAAIAAIASCISVILVLFYGKG
jgi:hypothetical protein